MRIEIYTIGELTIPDEKSSGINTKRAKQNFPSSSQYVNKNLTKAYLQVKLATSNSNNNINILPKRELLTDEKLIYLISNLMGIKNE